jgi:hypothetical protein
VEGQKHAWEEVWRAALDRCQNQMSPMAGLATPPSSSLIGDSFSYFDIPHSFIFVPSLNK